MTGQRDKQEGNQEGQGIVSKMRARIDGKEDVISAVIVVVVVVILVIQFVVV